ncbi:hypothetical protein ACA910_003172 [Epithemia clementina (nom. ined.)]
MSMNGFNNSGMGMGIGDGRFSMDDLQHSAGGMGSGMSSTGMGTGGMGSGMAGMGGYPGAGGMGAQGVSGFPGSNGMGNGNMLSQVGRDDELLISLLRERNQQLQGVSGGVPGVVSNIYGGSSSNGMPGGQSGILGSFNINPGGNGPYDLQHRDPQGGGLAFSPYLMDARAQDAMMRDFQNQNPGNSMLYDQQRPGLSASPATSGLGFPYSGFEGSGREQAQQSNQHQLKQHDEDADEMNRRVTEPQVDDERPVNTTAAASAVHANKPPPSKNSVPRATKKRLSKDAPRRPLSAYNLFFSDERERILKEREEAAAIEADADGSGKAKTARKIQVQEMAKIIGERWRGLPDEWRSYYQDLADEDMKRHKEAKKRTPKDPSVPKRPPTAFLLFSNKRRKALKRQYPDASNSDLSKMLSKTWREAPDSIRQKYMDEATDLSKVYKADMVVWRKKSGERKRDDDGDDNNLESLAASEIRSKKTRKKPDDDDFSDIADNPMPMGINMEYRSSFIMDNQGSDHDGTGPARAGKPSLPSKPPSKKRKTKDPSAPKRPLSAFLAFSNTRRKALKQQYLDATNADLSKMLSKMWREAPKEFRQKFIDDAAELSEAYKSEMAEWRMKSAA